METQGGEAISLSVPSSLPLVDKASLHSGVNMIAFLLARSPPFYILFTVSLQPLLKPKVMMGWSEGNLFLLPSSPSLGRVSHLQSSL